jgi:hypothetical protein
VAIFRPSSPPMHALLFLFFRVVKCHLLHILVNEQINKTNQSEMNTVASHTQFIVTNAV